jgi:hypothetical protein
LPIQPLGGGGFPSLRKCCSLVNFKCTIQNGEVIPIVEYRAVSEQWLCGRRPLLGNARNTHARNNGKAGLCNPFLSNGSVNTPTKIVVLLGTVFYIRFVQSGYKEELVENRQSSSGVPSEQLVESWDLQGGLRRWRYEFSSVEFSRRVQVWSINHRITT